MKDRDLILGVLATQARFVTPAQVMEAASARLIDPGGPTLLDRLVQSGALKPEQRVLLEAMADAAPAADGKSRNVLGSLGAGTIVSQTVTASEAQTPPADSASPEADWPILPEREGQYARLGELGRGGQSVVLLALDRSTGREVALKELRSSTDESPAPRDSQAGARFLREVRLTAQLDHPGIVAVHELARRPDGTLFCAEKLIRGETLKHRLAGCSSLRQRLALLPHLVDACQAIAYAHSRGVIHRDLKPSNVMAGAFGETVVVDWGLAKKLGDPADATSSVLGSNLEAEPDLTLAGVALGTPAYMSPEQARGALEEIDQRSDVFSLGSMLYEVLSGRPPFAGATNSQIIEKVIAGAPVPVGIVCREVPAELAAIAERALQRRPADRYQSAEALADDLLAYRSGDRVDAYEYRSWELIKKFVRRRPSLSIAVAVALLVLAGFSLNTWRQLRLSRITLAASLLDHARDAERDSDWGRAAAYYAASRIQEDSREAQWGYALARQRMPHRIFARRGPQQSVIDVGHLRDGRAVALAIEPPFVVVRELDGGRELWRFEPPAPLADEEIQPSDRVALWTAKERFYLDAETGHSLGTFRKDEAVPCSSGPLPPPVLRKPEGLVTAGPTEPFVLSPNLPVRSPCRVSGDGQRVAFKDAAGVVHLWDLRDRHELASRQAPDASQLLFTAHGLAVVRAGSIQVFGGTEGDFVVAIPRRGGNGLKLVGGRETAVSPDGNLLVTGRLTSNQADLVDLRTRTVVSSFSYPSGTPKFTFSPSSDQLLVAGLLDGSVVAAWDVHGQGPEKSVRGSRRMAVPARVGHRFEMLQVGFDSSRYEVWDESGARLSSGVLGKGANATISADGTRVGLVDAGGVTIRDAVSGELLFRLACDGCLRVALSSTGDRLLTFSPGGIELWDRAQGKPIWNETRRVGGMQGTIDLSADGQRVLWARGVELFVSTASGATESRLPLDEMISDAQFNHDGTKIAVVTAGTIGIWETNGLRLLWRARNVSPVEQEVRWSNDESALIVLYDSLGTALLDSSTGERFANLSVTRPGAYGTQEVVLPSLRHRISRGDGIWEMWPIPPPDDRPPRESLQLVLSEAGLEMHGVELVDAAPASK